MHRLRHLLVAAFILSSVGCSSAKHYSEATAAPSPPSEGWAGSGGGGGMPGAMDDRSEADYGGADEEYRPAVPADLQPTAALGAPPPAKQAPPPPGPQPTPTPGASGGEGVDKGKEPQKQFARQVIYTADMTISCFKLEDAMERAEALTIGAEGYVQSLSQGYLVLRIPAPQLRRVMEELGKLGVVESRNLQAQDVTQDYYDVVTRIRVLREQQSQLLTLLKQARNVEEALNVRRTLDQTTMELEQALGRLRVLENQIGYSTLTVRLSERGPQNAVPSSNDPFPWVDTLGVEATEWN